MATLGTFQVPFLANPPSIGTSLNNLGNDSIYSYFGRPPANQPVSSYDAVNETMRTLPAALKGRSVYLERSIELLSLISNSALTSVILPLMITEDIRFLTTKWTFQPYLPDRVPHLGVVRYVKSQYDSTTHTLTRYGIGFTLEHGFMETPMGREHYIMEIRQITQAINESLQFEALYALMNAHANQLNRMKNLQGDGSTVHNSHVDNIIQRELDTWAFMQQTRYAWDRMNDFVDRSVLTYSQVGLTTWLIDIRVDSFRRRIAEDQTTFSIHGPGFLENIQEGAQFYSVDGNGNAIYAMRSFLVGDNSPVNPLERRAQIGEYFRCLDLKDTNYDKYTSALRTQQFFSEDADGFVDICLADKLKHCHRFNDDGSVKSFDDLDNIVVGDDEEMANDFLHFRRNNGEIKPMSMFGQLRQEHFNPNDYKNMARTVYAALKRISSYKRKHYERAFSVIGECLRVMGDISYSESYENWVALLREWNPNTASINTGMNTIEGVPSGNGDVLGNEFHSLDMFPRGTAPVDSVGWSLPPTHGTYGGFKTIEKLYKEKNQNFLAFFGDKYTSMIAKVMPVYDAFVQNIDNFFPKCLLLSPAYASTNIHNPMPHDTLFENLLARNHPSRAIHMRTAGIDVSRLGVDTTGRDIEGRLRALQNALSTLTRDVTGPLEVLQTGLERRGRIQLAIGSDADQLNVRQVPGSTISNNARALGAALDDAGRLNELKVWMMIPSSTLEMAKAKAKVLMLLSLVKVRVDRNTYAPISAIVPRFVAVLNAIAAIVNVADPDETVATLQPKIAAASQQFTDLINAQVSDNANDFAPNIQAAIPRLLQSIEEVEDESVFDTSSAEIRVAPIRIGRTAFLQWMTSGDAATSNFVPAERRDPRRYDTSTNISSEDPITDPAYAQVGGPSSDVLNLPVRFNAKLRENGVSAPRSRAYRSASLGIPAASRRSTGMLNFHAQNAAKRARYDSKIVGGSVSEKVELIVAASEYVTDNIDEEFPQHMRNTFSDIAMLNSGSMCDQIAAMAFMFTPITKQAMAATISHNLLHPFDYLITRPHATYVTVTSIKLRPGAQTGNTAIGNIQVHVGDDTTTGVHTASIKHYQGVIIREPKYIYALNNSMVVGYEGGLGAGFIDPDPSKYNPKLGIFGDSPQASIIVIATPLHEVYDSKAFSLDGQLVSTTATGETNLLASSSRKYSYNTAAFYNSLWNFTQFKTNVPLASLAAPNKMTIRPNLVVFKSTALYRDQISGQYDKGTVNLGHWRPSSVGVGAHRARIGQDSFHLSGVLPYKTQVSV